MGQKNFFFQFLHTIKSYYWLPGTCHLNREAKSINKFLNGFYRKIPTAKSILNIVRLKFNTFITPNCNLESCGRSKENFVDARALWDWSVLEGDVCFKGLYILHQVIAQVLWYVYMIKRYNSS